MGWVDLVPRAGKLFLGGLHALYQKPDLFEQAGITHLLSILDFDIYETGHFERYKYLHIRIDDHPNENLLQHFEETNRFIDDALSNGGGVFIHCAMGKSRTSAVCSAFLMQKYGISPEEALAQICEGRPVCQPNVGFTEQLSVFNDMLKAKNGEESERIYQKWLDERYTGPWWSWDKRQTKL